MAGVLDLHTLLALKNGWHLFTAVQADFNALFSGVDSSLLDAWHTELVKETPQFRAHAAQRTGEFPCLVVQLASETMLNEPLSGAAYRQPDGRLVESVILEQQVRITIMTRNAELTRAAHVVARATLQLARSSFIQLGYIDLRYSSGEELTPEEELVADDMGIYVRRMLWTAKAQVDFVPPLATVSAPINWFVATSDLTVDGEEGGVVPLP